MGNTVDHVSKGVDHASKGDHLRLMLSRECKISACILVSCLSFHMALSSFKGTYLQGSIRLASRVDCIASMSSTQNGFCAMVSVHESVAVK